MREAFSWPRQRQCAVSLTYDDGLPVHYELVGPLLEQHGLRATFYTMVDGDLLRHPERWASLARAGHELGNHSIFHPCRRTSAGQYPWLDEGYNLCSYSPARLRSELEVANLVLRLLDGQEVRSYGNTCCDTTIGAGPDEQSMEPVLARLFVAARGSLTGRPALPGPQLNLLNVGCISADGRSLMELQALIEQAREQAGWAVLMIHGIGAATHSLQLEPAVHEQLISWLGQQRDIWTAPLREVAGYVRGQQARA